MSGQGSAQPVVLDIRPDDDLETMLDRNWDRIVEHALMGVLLHGQVSQTLAARMGDEAIAGSVVVDPASGTEVIIVNDGKDYERVRQLVEEQGIRRTDTARLRMPDKQEWRDATKRNKDEMRERAKTSREVHRQRRQRQASRPPQPRKTSRPPQRGTR